MTTTEKRTHPPGPWTAETFFGMRHPLCLGDHDGRHMIISEGGQGLASTVGLPDATDEANARLIAAAPDLLAACKTVLETMNGPDMADADQLGRAAIAKAQAD